MQTLDWLMSGEDDLVVVKPGTGYFSDPFQTRFPKDIDGIYPNLRNMLEFSIQLFHSRQDGLKYLTAVAVQSRNILLP